MTKSKNSVFCAVAIVLVACAAAALISVARSEISALKDRIAVVEVYTYDQIEKNVIKQADKITSGNFGDIKVADLEDALKYFPLLENPSEASVVAYEIVKEYYQQVIGYALPVLVM